MKKNIKIEWNRKKEDLELIKKLNDEFEKKKEFNDEFEKMKLYEQGTD